MSPGSVEMSISDFRRLNGTPCVSFCSRCRPPSSCLESRQVAFRLICFLKSFCGENFGFNVKVLPRDLRSCPCHFIRSHDGFCDTTGRKVAVGGRFFRGRDVLRNHKAHVPSSFYGIEHAALRASACIASPEGKPSRPIKETELRCIFSTRIQSDIKKRVIYAGTYL